MTTGAVVADRLLILPVTVKARVVTVRHGLEKFVRRGRGVRLWLERDVYQQIVPLMTNRTVIVVRLPGVVAGLCEKGSTNKARHFVQSAGRPCSSDHVLMLVVRKLDRELPFVFWLRGLAGAIRVAENEAPVFTRGGAHMTHRANSRTRAGERLVREKLLSMTTNTGIMIWKVSHVRKVAFCRPGGRHFVAGITGQTLMLVG